MAFENLFIRTQKSIGGIQLDAVLSETHSNTVRLTKNPVELGADITDHRVIEPKRVNILASVSDTPLGTAAFAQIVDLVTGLFGTATSDNITRSNAAYNAMVQLQEIGEPVNIQTKLRLYENMIITNISTTQDAASSRIVQMNIAAEEVIITESEIVALTSDQLESGSPAEQATSALKRGRQSAVIPTESVNRSVLKSVTNWVGG